MTRRLSWLLASAMLLTGCSAGSGPVITTASPATTPSPAAATSPAVTSPVVTQAPGATQPRASTKSAAADPGVVIAGTGDIAEAGASAMANSASTAALVRAAQPQFVFTTGDNAYPAGSPQDFATKYDPVWGSFKAITRPTPGNHEYRSKSAHGYLAYFGAAKVTNPVDGGVYYAFDLGKAWRAYALNSEISMSATSAQYAWLFADLSAHPGTHVLAYWHQPRFVSKVVHGDRVDQRAIWDLLRRHGADIVMSGHEHHAERFAKLDGAGRLDPRGIREFITGTGGNRTYGLPRTRRAHSEFANGYDYGVLRLTLHANSYDWAFIASGRAHDGSSDVRTSNKGRVLDAGTAVTNITTANP